jgi:hypothetical protein
MPDMVCHIAGCSALENYTLRVMLVLNSSSNIIMMTWERHVERIGEK